ncbi:major facilitator superfamily domain-containing protein, partial [Diplogelasinospora grovesii]
ILCMIVYFFHQMQGFLPIGPYMLLYERSICYAYYHHWASGAVDELLCKIGPVQHELAVVRAWEGAFSAIPVFLVAVPYGKLADHRGKKGVIAASLFGLILACVWTVTIGGVWLVWLAPVLWLIGGGDFMPASLVFLLASGLVQENQRSQLYYYLYCIYLATELIAPYMASSTMDASVYLPLALTLACLLISLLALTFIREARDGPKHSEQQSFVSPTPGDAGRDSDAFEAGSIPLAIENDGFVPLLRTPNVVIALILFISPAFRPTTTHVLLQYMSTRFQWKLSQSTVFISEVAVVNIVLFLLILPRLLPWLETRFKIAREAIDLWVVRASLILLVSGALLLGLAPSVHFIIPAVAVFAAGFGLRVSLLSFATSLAENHLRSRFYGVIQMMENVGYLIAAPILQAAWASALEMRGPWLILPFMVVAVSYATELLDCCTSADEILGNIRRIINISSGSEASEPSPHTIH